MSKNILFLAGLGRPGGGKSPPLPSPADAHAQNRFVEKKNTQKLSKKVARILGQKLICHDWLIFPSLSIPRDKKEIRLKLKWMLYITRLNFCNLIFSVFIADLYFVHGMSE
jgi:hypothetical protein